MVDVTVRQEATGGTGAGDYPYQAGFGNEFAS
jgi:hypothetical protein